MYLLLYARLTHCGAHIDLPIPEFSDAPHPHSIAVCQANTILYLTLPDSLT